MKIPDSFLLDEVRCGFLIPSAIKQAWAAQLEVLLEIDRVCKKHNIQYFADWGTLLGAVRHGGYVPWDDDLDIVMKRADYEKFLKVAALDMEEGFHVQTFRNQKDFWLFMGKVVGKNRFCFEKGHLRRFHNFPYIACVDIFVLDYVYTDPQKEEKRRILCKYMLGVADTIVENNLPKSERAKYLKNIEELGGGRLQNIEDPVEMGRYLYGEVEKRFAEVPEQEAKALCQLFPWGLKGDFNHCPKEYYENPISLPFECIEIPVPRLYDKMLRSRYGDYMRFQKDAGAHNYPFFEGQKVNLQKVLDFPLPEFCFESSKMNRSEEEEAYRNLSYKSMAKECATALWEIKEQMLDYMERRQVEEAVALLQESQQLAIDMGTMLEQMLGEGIPIVSLLEKYCEVLFMLYEQLLQEGTVAIQDIEQLHLVQQDIMMELEQNILGRKTILFLPVLAKDWNGLHALWQEACADASCDTYVVPLPYFYKDYDSSPKEMLCEIAQFPEEVGALDYRILTPEFLEMLHPEVIVIQNPYDGWNPVVSVANLFYGEKLRKYTEELVYVPPFMVEEYSKEQARAYSNMKYYVTMPGVVYADKVIVQSENMRQLYVEKLVEFAGEETRAVWEQRIKALGLPATEGMVSENASGRNSKKKILYGISKGTYLEDPEAAQRKIKRNMQVFEQYKEQIEVTILHFPEEKISTVDTFDAYYGDPMPIVMDFMQARKPVMIQNISL